MRLNDIEYARDIFTELVVSMAVQRGRLPTTPEAEVFATKALGMAKVMATAQHILSERRPPMISLEARCKGPPTVRSPTFGQVADQWIAKAVKRSAGGSSRSLRSVFARYVLPHVGAKAIDDIESQDILSIVRSIEEAGHMRMAYATFHDLRFLYRFALAAGLTTRDPTAVLRRAIQKPKAKGTSMILEPDSVGRLLVAMRKYTGKPGSTAKYMLRLLPMLFLRASELRTLEWKDVDLEAATIVVPAERMKMRRPHVVPLARQAVRILRDVYNVTGAGRYVFTSGRMGDEPLDFSIFFAMFKSFGYRKGVSPQGFRVLASTWLNEQAWPAEVIERQLSHLGSDRTRRIYNHAEHLAQRRTMMQAWADQLEALERKTHISIYARRVL